MKKPSYEGRSNYRWLRRAAMTPDSLMPPRVAVEIAVDTVAAAEEAVVIVVEAEADAVAETGIVRIPASRT